MINEKNKEFLLRYGNVDRMEHFRNTNNWKDIGQVASSPMLTGDNIEEIINGRHAPFAKTVYENPNLPQKYIDDIFKPEIINTSTGIVGRIMNNPKITNDQLIKISKSHHLGNEIVNHATYHLKKRGVIKERD